MNKITKKDFMYILTTRPSVFMGVTTSEVSDEYLQKSIDLAKVQGYEKQIRYAEKYSNGLRFRMKYNHSDWSVLQLNSDRSTTRTCYETLDKKMLVCQTSWVDVCDNTTHNKYMYYYVL